jgi:hypothetical protein
VTSVRDAITVNRLFATIGAVAIAYLFSRGRIEKARATAASNPPVGLDVGLVDRLTVGRSTPAVPPHDHAVGDDSTVGSSEGLSNRMPADRLLNEAHP